MSCNSDKVLWNLVKELGRPKRKQLSAKWSYGLKYEFSTFDAMVGKLVGKVVQEACAYEIKIDEGASNASSVSFYSICWKVETEHKSWDSSLT